MIRIITAIVVEGDEDIGRMPDHRDQMRLRSRGPVEERTLWQKMLMSHPPIPERIGFCFRKILADVGRGEFISVGEQVLQPSVAGFLGGRDENTEIVRHFFSYHSGSRWFREIRGIDLGSVLSASGVRVKKFYD